MGRGGFLLQREREVKRPSERAMGGADGDTPCVGTLCLGVWLLHWGGPATRDAPKNHLGTWRLVLRAGKLFPLLGKPSSNSMALPPCIPTLPGGVGGSWLRSHREESQQSWTIVHPKAHSTPRTPNPPCPPLLSNRPMGLVLFIQGKGQAGTQQWLWQQQRGVASKFQLTMPWSSLALHPTHRSVSHPNSPREKQERRRRCGTNQCSAGHSRPIIWS